MTYPAQAEAPPLRLYNTMGRRDELFEPITPPKVLMYTCGPTVYHFAHIGNLRSFLTADVLRRVLSYNGYDVVHVKNITDVGHLRDDVLGAGEDRIEAAARREGKSPADLVDFYTRSFLDDEARLNFLRPTHRPRASDYIGQMIGLGEKLIAKGFAYAVDGNVYFDVMRFPSYGALSGNRIEDLVAGHRVEVEPNKRHPADFALWKAGDPGRVMNWASPWGPMGFPGWHIECSTMASELLGPQIDIHTGGVDNLFPHHEDERAQSEAANDAQFVRYWVHTAHLLMSEQKMAKSLGNVSTLSDIMGLGIHPLAVRFFLLQGHYRKQLSWTPELVEAAQTGLERIWDQAAELMQEAPNGPGEPSELRGSFLEAINDDLGLPRALATLQEALDSPLPPQARLALILDMDTVLGLDIENKARQRSSLTEQQMDLIKRRDQARAGRDWKQSDEIRTELRDLGVEVRDTPSGQRWLHRTPHSSDLRGGQ